jgi:hypothetical protein
LDLPGGLVDKHQFVLIKNICNIAIMLVRRHKFNADMAVLVIIQINKGGNPFADLAW